MTDDESKRIILSRRARFIAAALASAGLAANPACGGDVDDEGGSGGTARDAAGDQPQVCLQPPGGRGGVGGVGGFGGAPFDATSEPVPCLEPPIDASSEPVPCLSIAVDAGSTDAPDARADADSEPQPCLVPPAS
jgi:hypothetical protein